MGAMNKKQLQAILAYLGVPERLYDLGTNMRLDACVAMEENKGGWDVFITERGGKFDVARYNNETDACLNLLNRVVHMER